jgi:excisionase family DNA binding protein
MADALWTVPEVAEKLRITPDQLARMCRQGEVPHVRVGRSRRFTSEHIAELIIRFSVAPEPKLPPAPPPLPPRRRPRRLHSA